jgi:hypothetical protein
MAAEVIPRRDHRAHAQGNVTQLVALSGKLDRRGGCVQAQRFARVELQEVDGLADVGVCLSPVLADFAGEPRAEFELAQADETGSAKEQGSALLRGGAAPRRKRSLCRSHCQLDVALVGALVDADHLGGPGGIDGDDLRLRLDPLSADDEIVFVPEPVLHRSQRLLHRALR